MEGTSTNDNARLNQAIQTAIGATSSHSSLGSQSFGDAGEGLLEPVRERVDEAVRERVAEAARDRL